MNRKLKTILIIMAVIAAISTIGIRRFPYSTEAAVLTEVRKTVNGSGFVLRNETVLRHKVTGVFEAAVQDGERVSKGSKVGNVISGNLNKELAKELKEVTARIENIKNSGSIADLYESDDERIYLVMHSLAASIRECVEKNDYEKAQEHKNSFAVLAEKRYSAEKGTARDKLLLELEQRQYELETEIGGMHSEITAPEAGFFYTELDGLEGYSDRESLEKLTVEEIKEFDKIAGEYSRPEGDIGKICDSYVWYLAAKLPVKKAEEISAGQTVKLSVDRQLPVEAKVFAVNFGKKDAVVVLECTRSVSGIMEKRVVDFEIETEKHRGLRVPGEALRVINDVTGVYVISENDRVEFKCVDVIYKEDDCYVARRDYAPPEEIKDKPLKLYDNILLNPEAVIKYEQTGK